MIQRILFILILTSSYFFSHAQKIHMAKENGGYWILEDNHEVFFLQRELNTNKAGLTRNNFLHPVYDLNGNCITEDSPEDHPHHRGIFWAWHQIIINNKQVSNGWLLTNFTQRIKNLEFVSTSGGMGVLKYDSFWYEEDDLNDPILREKIKISTYLSQGKYRRIDFEIELQALENNLKLGGSNDEKGYGGFSARIKTDYNTSFIDENGLKLTPTNLQINGGRFVNIVNNKSGLVIIDRCKSNQGKWILRQKGSMQNAVWPGAKPIDISITKPHKLKYSLIIHNGKLKHRTIKKIINNQNL